MTVHRSEVVHITIGRPPMFLEGFLRDVTEWHRWAPWVHSAEQLSAHEWLVQSDVGSMRLRFVEPNAFGVLDHEVALESGTTAFNALRVVSNGDGSELVMVILQGPQASTVEFERDVDAVRADFIRMKSAAEAQWGTS